jgi:hypothetical protein
MSHYLGQFVPPGLDRLNAVKYLRSTWGVYVFKCSEFAFVLSLVVAVVLAAIVPIPDQPETSFNEVDTPVNEATLVAPVRITPPTEVQSVVSRPIRIMGTEMRELVLAGSGSSLTHRPSGPVHALLCIFLI